MNRYDYHIKLSEVSASYDLVGFTFTKKKTEYGHTIAESIERRIKFSDSEIKMIFDFTELRIKLS